ncbi:MAG: MFS transporter [Candidatus Hodarchaeales archaeon]
MSEFFGLSSFQFFYLFRNALIYTFLSIYLRLVIGLSATEVTIMVTLSMIANSISQSLLWGPLLDKLKKSVEFVIVGEIIAGLGHFLLYFWHKGTLDQGYVWFAGWTIIIGLGIIELAWGMSNVGWSAFIAERTNDDERSRIIAQFSIIGGLGGIAGASSGGILYNGGVGFSNGVLFFLAAIVMIFSGIFLLVIVDRKKKSNAKIENDQQSNLSAENSVVNKKFPTNLKKVYFVFILALLFINFGRNSIEVLIGFFLVDPSSFSATDIQVALFRNITGLATMFGGIILGSAILKIEDKRLLISGTCFSLMAILTLTFAPSFSLVLIAAALIGGSQVIISASSYSIVTKMVPEEYTGRLLAYYNVTFFLSWGMGATLVTGPISDFLIFQGVLEATAYRISFLASAMLVIFGLVILLISFRLRNILPIHLDSQSIREQ